MLPVLFSLTLCLSAALLFWVQLFTARILLPILGGSASVWNTCLVFFQVALLLGYLYAHATEKWLPQRFRIFLHPLLLLAAAIALPVSLRGITFPAGNANPVLWQLETLLVIIGAPFLILSGTAPLLQAWFARSSQRSARDPYFLYAASNLGSFGALLSYPVLVEPHLRLTQQSFCWTAGYFLLIALTSLCAFIIYRYRAENAAPEIVAPSEEIPVSPAPSGWQRLRWIVYAFVPSSLLLGVTSHITANVASVPFLWIIPLALYLLSFVFAFQTMFAIPKQILAFIQALLLVTVSLLIFLRMPQEPMGVLVAHLVTFFVTALLCHYELARTRPATRDLTEFYLLISFGGALGGIFNALLAPVLFNSVVEYPLVLIAACLLRPGVWPQRRGLRAVLGDLVFPGIVFALLYYGQNFARPNFNSLGSYSSWITSVAVALLRGINSMEPVIVLIAAALMMSCFQWRILRFTLGVAAVILATAFVTPNQTILMRARDFYGVYKVISVGPPTIYILKNGTTPHGYQDKTPGLELMPIGYYHKRGPLGRLFKAIEETDLTRHVGLIGLGTGGIVSYEKPGDDWTYFEISPTDIAIADDPHYFTFLRDCPVHPEVIPGDGRLSLAKQPDRSFDMIIIDAFTSDAIPVHLITREAVQLYLSKIRPDGVIVFHISNAYFDLGPALGNIAASLNLESLRWIYTVDRDDAIREGIISSDWVIMTRDEKILKMIMDGGSWFRLGPTAGQRIWTDDYSNLFGALR